MRFRFTFKARIEPKPSQSELDSHICESDAASLLGVTRTALVMAHNRKAGPRPIYIGARRYYRLGDLLAYASKHARVVLSSND